MLKTMKAGILAIGLCACAAPAYAQMQWTDRGFINVNAGVQAGSHDLNTSRSFDLYDESEVLQSSGKVSSGAFFDVGVGYRMWQNVAVAISFLHSGSDSDLTVRASIPDPIFYNSPRTATLVASGAKHTENVVNLDAVWMVPFTDKIDFGISAGPSIFLAGQELTSALPIVSEPGPTVGSPVLSNIKKTTVGVNFGVDVSYMLTKRYGVGGVARYSWGSGDFGGGDNVTLGGFQIGAGLRVRF
ncbi:MAG TPA: outer membrane beta-barrel protein [Vicinamibacterales bacterium]|nr:outer membrane beta-barrel protein [Vicinamibacterales bacterium]